MFLIGDLMQDAKAYAKWCKKRSEFEKRTVLEIERISLEALQKGLDPY